MGKRSLALLFAFFLFVPASSPGGDPDSAGPGWGFVCRILPSQNTAVVTPLSGMFVPDGRIFFLDEKGERHGSGIVRSVYPDLAYVTIESGSADALKKGFIASSPKGEGEARMLCGFSLNLPYVIEKGGNQGHRRRLESVSATGAWGATKSTTESRPNAPGATKGRFPVREPGI